MKNYWKIIIGIVVVVIAFGAGYFVRQPTTPSLGSYEPKMFDVIQTRGFAIQNDANWTTGFTGMYAQKILMTAGTTTPCSFQSPSSTSTLQSFAAFFTSATTSAVTWVLATSTSYNATTSAIASKAVAASSQGAITWSAGSDNSLVSPYTYINLGANGAPYSTTAGITGIGGSCTAVFQTYNATSSIAGVPWTNPQ